MRFYDSFDKKELLAAHRGWRSIRPENTMSAFEAAVGHFDFIELDLQLSLDNRFVVMHDATLERTTDAALKFPQKKRPRRVGDFRLEELMKLDAGSWFLRSDPFKTIASKEVDEEELKALLPQKIPTLPEVLKFGRDYSMPLNLEIKDMPQRSEREVIAIFLETLGGFETPAILVSSFNHGYLKELKKRAPQIPTAALFNKKLPPSPADYLLELGAEACHADISIARKVPVGHLLENGIYSALFTVNDKKRQEEYYSLGFRALFADRPRETASTRISK